MVNKFLTIVILSAHFIESIRYIKSNIAHIGSNTSRSAQLSDQISIYLAKSSLFGLGFEWWLILTILFSPLILG